MLNSYQLNKVCNNLIFSSFSSTIQDMVDKWAIEAKKEIEN